MRAGQVGGLGDRRTPAPTQTGAPQDEEMLWEAEERLWSRKPVAWSDLAEGPYRDWVMALQARLCDGNHEVAMRAPVSPTGQVSGLRRTGNALKRPTLSRKLKVLARRSLLFPMPDIAVLAYQAICDCTAGDEVGLDCTSTYLRHGGVWSIIQHRQTPVR